MKPSLFRPIQSKNPNQNQLIQRFQILPLFRLALEVKAVVSP